MPSAISAPTPRSVAPSVAPAPLAPVAPSLLDDFAPRGMSDLERQADDIIANFRARSQTGLDVSIYDSLSTDI